MTTVPRKPAIPFMTLRRAERLLASGIAPMVVAKQLRVSRHTVANVQNLILRLQLSKNLVRCTGCGGMVEAPCRECSIRAEVL